MNPFRKYRRVVTQEMRFYVPGESLIDVLVFVEDIPEEGGMIARDSNDSADQWYVAKKFFEDNYVLAEENEPTN
jgi:hypothetical protein